MARISVEAGKFYEVMFRMRAHSQNYICRYHIKCKTTQVLPNQDWIGKLINMHNVWNGFTYNELWYTGFHIREMFLGMTEPGPYDWVARNQRAGNNGNPSVHPQLSVCISFYNAAAPPKRIGGKYIPCFVTQYWDFGQGRMTEPGNTIVRNAAISFASQYIKNGTNADYEVILFVKFGGGYVWQQIDEVRPRFTLTSLRSRKPGVGD